MTRWKNIILWTTGIALLILVSSFGSYKSESLKVSGVEIDIDYTDHQYFVKKNDVASQIMEMYPYIDSLHLREININLLEESLDNHPSIRKAEVYSSLDGILRIDVIQKKPLARVQNSTSGFYIDEKGDSMQLSSNYSAKVPLVTGLTSLQEQRTVFDFLKSVQQDDFFKNLFAGIHINANGEWVLYPKPGNHKVRLGKPQNLDKKLERLKTFYQTVVDQNNIDSIKTLDLKYDGQVICRKHS